MARQPANRTVRPAAARKAVPRKAAAPRKTPASAAPLPARRSPLHDVLRQGRFGASQGAPGVSLGLRHPCSIATIIARKGKAKALSEAMKKAYGVTCPEPGGSSIGRRLNVHWCGAEQWFAMSDQHPEGALYDDLAARLAGLASVSDQSHGRVVIAIKGPKAAQVLAKGTPVDLHPSAFPPGASAMTQMAHVGVHLVRTAPDRFVVSVFRGFAQSFWEWLTEMSAEFGYEVL